MGELTELAEKAINMCNVFHIVFNIIFLIIITILIVNYLIDESRVETVEAEIKSIKGGKCKETSVFVQDKYGGHTQHDFDCQINVEYKDKKNKTHTMQLNTTDKDHEVGETVYVDYSKKDPSKATYRSDYATLLFIIGICVFVLLSVGTFVRFFYKDNKWVKFWIGWTCLDDLLR